jgi:hypothetical protein
MRSLGAGRPRLYPAAAEAQLSDFPVGAGACRAGRALPVLGSARRHGRHGRGTPAVESVFCLRVPRLCQPYGRFKVTPTLDRGIPMNETKLEARVLIGEKEYPALLHLFRVDRDDMKFRFGRASVSGLSAVNSLVNPQTPSIFPVAVDGFTEPWRLAFFSGTTEWETMNSPAITHADFYVMGCPEMA